MMESSEVRSRQATETRPREILEMVAQVADSTGEFGHHRALGQSVEGAHTLALLSGQVLYPHNSGQQHLGNDAPPASDSTTFSLFSAGKFISLDKPLLRLLSDFNELRVIAESKDGPGYTLRLPASYVTLRHLLNNSSGIMGDDHPLGWLWKDNNTPPDFHQRRIPSSSTSGDLCNSTWVTVGPGSRRALSTSSH